MVHAVSAVIAADGRKLASMDTVLLGGSMVTLPILKLCLDFGAKRVMNAFGMTEGVVIGSGAYAQLSVLVNGDDVAVGKILRGSSAKVCAPDSRKPVPRNRSGELHFSGPLLIPGYIGKKTDDFYEENGKRWFRTGDQAYIDDQDRVFISGRYKEMIIRGGENISPAAIESRLNESAKLRSLNPQVVGVPDTIAGEVPVAVVLGKPDGVTVKEVQDVILHAMGNIYVPDEIIPISTLGLEDYPKTMAGKVKKTELAALVRKHRHDRDEEVSRGFSDDQLEERIKKIWARAVGLGDNQIDTNAPVADFADSITIMRVRDKVQRETGKSLSLQEMAEANTISEQIKLLKAQSTTTEKRRQIRPKCTSPLTADDMVHTAHNPKLFSGTKRLVEKNIKKNGLAWADVEDVMPAYDFVQMLAQTHIIDSWNFKIAIVPSKKTDTKVRARNHAVNY